MKYPSSLCTSFLSGCSCFISPYDTVQLRTKKDISPCHTRARTHTQTRTSSPKLNRCHTKPTSHQNFPIVKIKNIRPNLASSCARTHHFHFDSVFLTNGFLSPPASPPLHISNLRRCNKFNLNITSAADTKGRRETQNQS